MIKSIVTATLFTLSLGLVAGCGKDTDHCAEFAKKLAGDKGDVKAARAWVDKEMTGPDDKPLSGDQLSTACKMIVEDKDVFATYQDHYNEKAGK